MKLVLQPEGSKLCFAACVAMLTNTTLEDVLQYCVIHEEGWLPLSEAIKYLAHHEYVAGLNASLKFDLSAPPDEIHTTVIISLHKLNALVTVKSFNFKGHNHCIVWCAEQQKFLDPLGSDVDVSVYELVEWSPIQKIEGVQ